MLEKNFRQVAAVTEAIIKYSHESSAKLIVHADMTGGMRHASMLMLEIIELLKYQGIQIGEILYANLTGPKLVYQATEIQKMFSLISGVDEFINFGSVQSLEDYFGDDKGNACRELLESMRRFSETLKICGVKNIIRDLDNLRDHIVLFREDGAKNFKEEIFSKLLNTVEDEYGVLLKGRASRIDIIRWCLGKGFYQQALTFFTEWIPIKIVESGLYKPQPKLEKDIIEKIEIEGKNTRRTWKQYFVINFNDYNFKLTLLIAKARNIINTYKLNSSNNIFNIKSKDEKLVSLITIIKEYDACNLDFSAFKNNQNVLIQKQKDYPNFFSAMRVIYNSRNKNNNFSPSAVTLLTLCKKVKYDTFLDQMEKLSQEYWAEILKMEYLPHSETEKKHSPESDDNKWLGKKEEYKKMLDRGIAVSDYSSETTLNFLQGYHRILFIRNQINHANSKFTMSISELREIIETYLNEFVETTAKTGR